MKISSGLALVSLCVALAPLSAAAGEKEDQAACMNDAMTICSQFIPDRERVANCLISNSNRVSEACRVALTHFDQQAGPPANSVAVNSPVAAPPKSLALQQPAAPRAKVTAVKQPLELRPKLTTANQPATSRAKLTAIR